MASQNSRVTRGSDKPLTLMEVIKVVAPPLTSRVIINKRRVFFRIRTSHLAPLRKLLEHLDQFNYRNTIRQLQINLVLSPSDRILGDVVRISRLPDGVDEWIIANEDMSDIVNVKLSSLTSAKSFFFYRCQVDPETLMKKKSKCISITMPYLVNTASAPDEIFLWNYDFDYQVLSRSETVSWSRKVFSCDYIEDLYAGAVH